MHEQWNPCIELTHNHGTEVDPNFSYHNGNTDPVGFSSLQFSVDNAESFLKHKQVEKYVLKDVSKLSVEQGNTINYIWYHFKCSLVSSI